MPRARPTAAESWYTPDLRALDRDLVGTWWRCPTHSVQSVHEVVLVGEFVYCGRDDCGRVLKLVSNAKAAPPGTSAWTKSSSLATSPAVRRSVLPPPGPAAEDEELVEPTTEEDAVSEGSEAPAEQPTSQSVGGPAPEVPADGSGPRSVVASPPPKRRRRRVAFHRSPQTAFVAVSRRARRCCICDAWIASPLPHVLVTNKGHEARICAPCGKGFAPGDEVFDMGRVAACVVLERPPRRRRSA